MSVQELKSGSVFWSNMKGCGNVDLCTVELKQSCLKPRTPDHIFSTEVLWNWEASQCRHLWSLLRWDKLFYCHNPYIYIRMYRLRIGFSDIWWSKDTSCSANNIEVNVGVGIRSLVTSANWQRRCVTLRARSWKCRWENAAQIRGASPFSVDLAWNVTRTNGRVTDRI